MLAEIVNIAFTLYFYAVFAWVILSWIPVTPGHPLDRVRRFLDRMIDPVVRPIRRVIPPLRLGAGALDLSPLVLLFGLRLLHGPAVRLAANLF